MLIIKLGLLDNNTVANVYSHYRDVLITNPHPHHAMKCYYTYIRIPSEVQVSVGWMMKNNIFSEG